MHIYQFVIEPDFMKRLKIWAAQAGKSIKSFLMEAAIEKAEKDKLK